jgi:apolipoprotein N-acyltransferase
MTWRNGALAVFGAWFIVSPFVFGLQHATFALWSSVIVGALLLLGAVWALTDHRRRDWLQWLMGVFGLYLGLLPWLAGTLRNATDVWITALVGLATIVAAVWNALVPGGETGTEPAHRQAS